MAWKLMPIKLPPGVFRNGTHYESKGRWYNVNLVRWFRGVMRPIGGWLKALDNGTLTGYGRSGISWKLNDGGRRLVIGTEQKLYGWNGGTLSDITPVGFLAGRQSTVQGFGYGSGPYGEEGYGDQRTTGTPLVATTWSMDLWGDDWVGVASHEQEIYQWGGAGGTPASLISGAPLAGAVFVTPERIMVALAAAGNPRQIKWSDSEDNTQWTPTQGNQAGDQILTTQGHIVSGHRLAGGQNVILTTADVWNMSYIGPPFIYGFEKQGQDCGVVGNLASVEFDGRLAWMGRNQFWVYDGQVRPIPSEVGDYVFGNLNQNAVEKVFTAHIPRFNEIWWFYPTGTDASAECSEYVIYNYREGTWSIGSMSRCGWVNDSGIWGYPFGIKTDGKVYEHENGWTDDGVDRGDSVYAQSGPAEIGNGGQTLWVNQIIPDEDTQGEVRLKVYTRFAPNGTVTSHGPYTISSDYVDARLQGRMVSLRVEEVASEDWRWGVPRLNAQAGSGR